MAVGQYQLVHRPIWNGSRQWVGLNLRYSEIEKVSTSLRNRKACKLHELINREGTDRHEVLVQCRSIFGGECLYSFSAGGSMQNFIISRKLKYNHHLVLNSMYSDTLNRYKLYAWRCKFIIVQ